MHKSNKWRQQPCLLLLISDWQCLAIPSRPDLSRPHTGLVHVKLGENAIKFRYFLVNSVLCHFLYKIKVFKILVPTIIAF